MKYYSLDNESLTLTRHRKRGLLVCNICLLSAALIFAACGSKPPAVVQPEVIEEPEVKPPPPPLLEMVLVPEGSFKMGSAKGTANSYDIERPVHDVTLNAFYMGKYEVTQSQYFEVTGNRPSNFKTNGEDAANPDGWMKLPVEMVSWYEALVFCNLLSIKEGYAPVYRVNGSTGPADWGEVPARNNSVWNSTEMVSGANGYRLPTEAEWEYAARGGDGSPDGFTYAGSNTANDVSWYYDNSGYKVHEIGKKAPNSLGLYDLSGNVMEWCWDWLGDYKAEAQHNPAGPSSGTYRIIRGGGWSVSVQNGRVAYRHNNNPSYKGVNLGLRVVRPR